MKFVIKGEYYGDKTFPSLNDYLQEVARNPKDGNQMKRKFMNIVINSVRKGLGRQKVTNPPVIIHYKFYEPSKGQKRDVMNIFSVVDKFVEDALVKCGVLEDDNPKFVANTTHEFYYTDEVPFIEIEIEERGKE